MTEQQQAKKLTQFTEVSINSDHQSQEVEKIIIPKTIIILKGFKKALKTYFDLVN